MLGGKDSNLDSEAGQVSELVSRILNFLVTNMYIKEQIL
jgi:hypothetical protein